ncbi:hypothetical protein Clacol_002234 [Clathrus columnatus]|uniref:Major facilitator superfamily (MFS) profile domain-containing protein n=1 Tax=Clathrus columnatus TaxID=1419009 RepID=A0AAV5A054_9AGAM|nr:hypothetical protein Clacol_002234 [Clathrus columnatus]
MAGGAAVSSGQTISYGHLIDRTPWYKNSHLLHHVLMDTTVGETTFVRTFLHTEAMFLGSMINGLQSLPQWQDAFNHPTGSSNIGSLSALPFAPYMADGLGRRFTIIFGACLMVAGTILQTASQNVRMFIGARWLLGFGVNFAATGAPMLISELAYPSQRGQITSMYNSLWIFGSIVAAWTTFGTFHIGTSWSWRIPSAIQGFPSIIQLVFIWFVPESPRWLVSKGREEEALDILAYYHARGNAKDPLVEFEFEEIRSAIQKDSEVKRNVGWLTLIKTPGNRRRMRIIVAIAFFSQWSGNGLTSYYLNQVFDAIGITDPTLQLLINGILQIYNFFICVIASMLCDKLGRRKLFLISTGGMLIFWTLETVCFFLSSVHGNVAAAHTFIAMIALFGTFYALAYSPLIVTYTIEILPYELRSRGFTFFNFVICLSLVFNQYVNPIALKALGWKYYTVYIAWLVFEVTFIYFYLIETKNRTLEETSALFDGDDTVVALSNQAAEKAEIRHRATETKIDDSIEKQSF